MDDRLVVAIARVVQLLDAREHEDLVVHRQPEGDAEQQWRHRGARRQRGEAQQAGQVALLEDPHQDAEHRREAEGVEHQGLHRQHHAAGEEEQHDECGEGDERAGQRQLTADGVLLVHQGRSLTCDVGVGPSGNGNGPCLPDEVLGGAALRIEGGDHR